MAYITACASGTATHGGSPSSVSTIERRLAANSWNCAQRGMALNRKDRAIATVLAGNQAAALIGGRALMVNAIDEEAAEFWRRRGFTVSKDDSLVLFRSIADIAASLTAANE